MMCVCEDGNRMIRVGEVFKRLNECEESSEWTKTWS